MSQSARANTIWDRVFRLRRAGRLADALGALDAEWPRMGNDKGNAEIALRASLYGEMARLMRQSAELSQAEALLRQALVAAPRFPDLHQQLGMVLLDASDLAGARVAFQESLAISPGYIAPALGLVLVAAKEGQLGDAIHSLEELARRRQPAEEDSYREGLELLRNGSWEEAEPLLLRAFHQADEELARAQQKIGKHLNAGVPLEALQEAQDIVARYPSYADSHHALGLSYLALDWWDDANEAFSRALRSNSDFHEARVYLAWGLFARGESARAEAELRRVLEADPDHGSARGLLGKRGPGQSLPVTDSAV
jgi:tetratricopeptide (TPR) repeat protein